MKLTHREVSTAYHACVHMEEAYKLDAQNCRDVYKVTGDEPRDVWHRGARNEGIERLAKQFDRQAAAARRLADKLEVEL